MFCMGKNKMHPYYIFDKNIFVQKLHKYNSRFDVFYPCKVNSTDNILRIVKEFGCGFEVDSLRMIEKLINEHSIKPEKILYNGLIRSEYDIKKAIEYGIRFFAIDTMHSLKFFEQIEYANVSFLIRISINSLLETSLNPLEKWGCTTSEAKAMADYIYTSNRFSLKGFSFYFPQEVKTIERIKEAIIKIVQIANGYENVTIDLGGGIDLDELDEITTMLPEQFNYMIEPGRHLVGDCFDLVCNILDYKNMNGRTLVFLDVGIYSGLIDVVIKKHVFKIEPLESNDGEKQLCYLCGCTSDISDIFGQYVLPTETIFKKEKLVIRNCGAYCLQMYMEFSEHEKPTIKER